MGALVVAAAALAVYGLMSARHDLVSARSLLRAATADPQALATPEGRARALTEVDRALERATEARAHLRGSSVLSAVGRIPGLSGQWGALLDLTADGVHAGGAARDLLATLDDLSEDIQVVDGRVPLPTLRQLRAAMADAGNQLATIDRGPTGLWGPLRDARRDFDLLVADGVARLRGASEALGAGLTFMGEGAPRTYLMAIQNNAEMRDQGMVLSYAVIGFDGGRLTFEGNGSVADLTLDEAVSTALPPGTEEVFGPLQPRLLWQSVNATADFALSGQVMADMYAAATGEQIDGVIGVDVPALALLLSAIGPVEVADLAEPVSAENAARVLLHDVYQGVPVAGTPERREKLDEVMQAVIGRLSSGTRNAVGLGLRLADAARGLHLRLWSADADEEAVFERTGLGGGPAVERPARTFHLAVQNRTATKLDYHVKTAVRFDVELTAGGDAVVRTTVVIDNQAPPDGEPSYALGPDIHMSRPGEYHAWLLLWAPEGSESNVPTVTESGLSLSQRVVVVDPGTHREFVLATTTIRHAVQDGRLDLRFVPQPRLDPSQLEIWLTSEGWNVRGPDSWAGAWDRVVRQSWEVRR